MGDSRFGLSSWRKAVFAVLLLRERLTRSKFVSFAVALSGVLLVLQPPAAGWASPALRGDVLILV